jgi:hypothetical protein
VFFREKNGESEFCLPFISFDLLGGLPVCFLLREKKLASKLKSAKKELLAGDIRNKISPEF